MIVKQSTRQIPPKNILNSSNNAAANTQVLCRANAVEGKYCVLHKVVWSYNATPTGGLLIQSYWNNNNNSANLFDVDITAAGPGGLDFNLDLNPLEDLLVTLKAAGATVTGKLNIEYSYEM